MNESLVVCVRGIISFFTLLIFTRILGEQQVGELAFFDYILGITIGSFAASLTVDLSSAAWPHWVGLLTWIILGYIMQIISLKSKKVAKYVNDEPIIVVYNGKILGDNLRECKITFEELLTQLRLKDIFDINEVKAAILETSGQLSVIDNKAFNKVIETINLPEEVKLLNSEVIFNGIIIESNLCKLSIDKKWIFDKMKSQGFDSPLEIFLAYIDTDNNLKVHAYKHRVISSKDIFK